MKRNDDKQSKNAAPNANRSAVVLCRATYFYFYFGC